MKVVIWARVSSREQREGYSIDAQLRACRERALKNGWTVVREFVVAESAKRGAERVAFNEMFKWVRANARREGIKAILAHKLDRVCRNMRDAVRLQELEDACGVQLAFVDNHFGPGAAGALSFNVMAAVAQYYSDNLRSEVLKGMDEKVRQGWPTGHAPYGYVNVADKDEPVQPHPEESGPWCASSNLYATGQTHSELAQEAGDDVSLPRARALLPLVPVPHPQQPVYAGELHRNGNVHRQIPALDRPAGPRYVPGHPERKNRRCLTGPSVLGGLIRASIAVRRDRRAHPRKLLTAMSASTSTIAARTQ